MTFEDVLNEAVAMLQRQGRVSYRALKRQFALDDEYLEDLTLEMIEIQQVAVDQGGRMLVWTGDTGTRSAPGLTSTPDAERRQLTVMFCDLVDSTKLSSQLDPEDYREVLRAYQATCSEIIQRFDGYVAQHLGDALLVYFGFPHAHEDDAQRATHTGLGMLHAMQTLNERLEHAKSIRLSIRVGIHTGLTVIGEVGTGAKHEMLALGEAPNVAARIQRLAPPDTVVISEATYRLIEGYFPCQGLGEQRLKGIGYPMPVYRVVGASKVQGRLDIATTCGLTPLVGRDAEVALLLEQWEQAKDGRGHVVMLRGEAGIGKSRLVKALQDRLAGESTSQSAVCCLPYYQQSAFYPIIDLLQRAVQFNREDPPTVQRGKLEAYVGQYGLPLPELVPPLAALLSIPLGERYPPVSLSPHQHKRRILAALLALQLTLVKRQPVLYIVEDVHWADTSTVEWLSLLLAQTPVKRMLVLLVFRPEFHPPWTTLDHCTQITLDRLHASHVETLVARLTGGKTLPAEVVAQVIAKTDGVPLFVEELVKMILESGLIREEETSIRSPVHCLPWRFPLRCRIPSWLGWTARALAEPWRSSVLSSDGSFPMR